MQEMEMESAARQMDYSLISHKEGDLAITIVRINSNNEHIWFAREDEALRYCAEPQYRERIDRVWFSPSYPSVSQSTGGHGMKCQHCNSELAHESGCLTCYSCGWSKCD